MAREIKSTVKYPTSLIINANNTLALELADSLLEQGGYVIMVDADTESWQNSLGGLVGNNLLTTIGYDQIVDLQSNLRRLDYVFYLGHESTDLVKEISTQKFLEYSNYLDALLELVAKFEAKFLLTTSLRAHQIMLSHKGVDVNFGRDTKAKHTIYTESEVQRYSESLVIEYIEKVDVDARIVRLGEIIGDGMDFLADTPFTKMVLAAVRGDNIPVYKDGLNSEWYVHILDAVYGLIKAQFSRNTAGELYTLAYEESYSDLSLAYKIHDHESGAGDIDFVEEQERAGIAHALTLYKPATNLAAIGWAPRIGIDEAVAQSLASAKLFLAEHTAAGMAVQQGDQSTSDKLKSFLRIAKEGDKQVDPNNPLDQLLEMRKQHDNARGQQVSTARARKRKEQGKVRNTREKVADSLWKIFLGVRSRFSPLAHLTPGQMAFWIVFLILTGSLYFGIVSPLAVLARNYYVVTTRFEEVDSRLAQGHTDELASDAAVIEGAITESGDVLGRLMWLLDLLAVGDEGRDLVEILNIYADYASGVKDIARAAEPFTDYLRVYEDTLSFVPNSESYLTLSNSYDYSEYLSPLTEQIGLARTGRDKIEQALTKLSAVDLSSLPASVRSQLELTNASLRDYATIASNQDLVELLPELLAVNDTRHYLVLLLDNSRYTNAGGDIAGYVLLTVQNGSLTDITASSINNLDIDIDEELQQVYQDVISDLSFSASAEDSLAINDLTSIATFSDFALAQRDIWEAATGHDIDGVITMNFTAVESLLEQVTSINGVDPVSVEGTEFVSGNLLSSLNLLQERSVAASISRRNDVAIQVLAQLLDRISDIYSQEALSLISSLAELRATKDIQVEFFSGTPFARAQETAAFYNSDSYVMTLLSADGRVIDTSSYPSIRLETRALVTEDYGISYQTKVNFPSLDTIDKLTVCLPIDVLDLAVEGLPASRYRTTTGLNGRCVVVNVADELEIGLNWRDTLAGVGIDQDGRRSINVGLFRQPGVDITSVFELQLSAGVSVISTNPEINFDASQNIFTEDMQNNRVINILME